MRKQDVTAVLAVAALYAGMELLGITCPIKLLTGISCAGCGMSRAWLSLLRLRPAEAFAYHPLFWLVPVAIAGWLLRRHIPKWGRRFALIFVCGLFLGVYLFRMLSPEDTVVVFAPREGLLFRAFVWILSQFRVLTAG